MSTQLFDLSGKVAIVTGSSRGLGRVIAEGLATAGAAVVTCSRRLARAEVTAAAIRSRGGRALAVEADTSSPQAGAAMVAAAVAEFGHLDIIVCNAGILRVNPAAEVTPEEWKETMAVNLDGYFYCAQAAARQMRRQGRGGAIIMISSNASTLGFPGYVSYCASKGAVDAMVRSLAVEWGEYDIRVNAINPGYMENIMAGMEEYYAGGSKEEAIKKATPIPRRGRNEELVGPVIFLASAASSFVTGVTLQVDGGYAIK